MSLFLGKAGRKIVNFSLTHPQTKVVKAANWVSNHVAELPGLTRETYQLWQALKTDNYRGTILVKSDGFYTAEKKLADNCTVATAFLKAGIKEIDTKELTGPEELA
ncbi:MAG TPA: hypothetical protein VMT55_05445, partial [Candidatus Sulfotelmatobacter sp.]|nr:hypothetical protein [Candidatus Sulfotelmatobacter sp.]